MDSAAAIDALKRNERPLRRLGVTGMSLFGSVARGEARDDSDVDVVVSIRDDISFGAFTLLRLEARLADMLGRPVDLITEPSSAPRLQAQIDRDRVRVF